MQYHSVHKFVHAVQGSRIDVLHVILETHVLWPILYLNEIFHRKVIKANYSINFKKIEDGFKN